MPVCVLESQRLQSKVEGLELIAVSLMHVCVAKQKGLCWKAESQHQKPEGTGNKPPEAMVKSGALQKKQKRKLPYSFLFCPGYKTIG